MQVFRDEEFLTSIVNRYSDMVLRVAINYTRNQSDAEDIMQEVFLKFITQKKFANEEHLKAWLIRVTINKAKNILKRNKAEIFHENFDAFSSPESSSLKLLLENLTDLEQTIIYLFYYEGYSAKEIGKIMGIKEGAVFTRLNRARNHLGKLLEDK